MHTFAIVGVFYYQKENLETGLFQWLWKQYTIMGDNITHHNKINNSSRKKQL